ncbi:MAG: hypothetical protein ACOC2F_06450 [Bacteroidota bacterium]
MKVVKKLFVIVFFIIQGCSFLYAQHMGLYYIGIDETKVKLKPISYYDIEEKPKVFYLQNIDDNAIYIIEIFRIIKNEKNSENHFYKSFSLTAPEMKNGFSVDGVFSELTSPFIISEGLVINLCKTQKSNYMNLQDRNNCLLFEEYLILTE